MERQTNATVDKKNHRLLFYSSIFVYSRDLFSLFFFFLEEIKSHFPFLKDCLSFFKLLSQLTSQTAKKVYSPFKCTLTSQVVKSQGLEMSNSVSSDF